MSKRTILLIVALIFMVGGIGRLVANESLFRVFQMAHLWSNEPFVIYNYKLLGVFVFWMGIVLLVSSADLIRYKGIIRGCILGLFLFFVVSLLAGLSFGLELKYFLVDSVFSIFLIVLFYIIQRD